MFQSWFQLMLLLFPSRPPWSRNHSSSKFAARVCLSQVEAGSSGEPVRSEEGLKQFRWSDGFGMADQGSLGELDGERDSSHLQPGQSRQSRLSQKNNRERRSGEEWKLSQGSSDWTRWVAGLSRCRWGYQPYIYFMEWQFVPIITSTVQN